MTDTELKELIEDCCNEIANKIEPLANVKSRLYESLKPAINYTRSCESVKEKYTHTFEVDLNSDKLKEQHCEQMKQIHSAPTRLFMYNPKTEQYIELKP